MRRTRLGSVLELIPKASSARPPRFKDLRIRPKLIVLHNAFFLLLTAAVYYALIPVVEEHIAAVQQRELALLGELFLVDGRTVPAGTALVEDRRFGQAESLEIAPQLRRWLDANPGEVYWDVSRPDRLYRKDVRTGRYGSLRFTQGFFEGVVTRTKILLFVALGTVYVLAVLALELFIMPRYVYRPLRATLDADLAVLEGDRAGELIAPHVIPGDEIGDIMRSRNRTVASLRDKEAQLEYSLDRSEKLAADLIIKNEQLESAERGLAAKDRLATIGLLAASVAHELNTPLSVIRGTTDKLLETVDSDRERSRLERIRRMSERLSKISEGLLDFTRAPQTESRSAVDLRALIDEAWNLLALDERAAGVEFRNEVDPTLRVWGDADRLIQVFVNLLKNGLFALEGSGAILVHAEKVRAEHRDWISVDVDDTGPGIPEDVLESLFEAFVSTRLDSQGNGLGLTVADGIVEQHDGSLTAQNRPEGGARLTVRLPAAT